MTKDTCFIRLLVEAARLVFRFTENFEPLSACISYEQCCTVPLVSQVVCLRDYAPRQATCSAWLCFRTLLQVVSLAQTPFDTPGTEARI